LFLNSNGTAMRSQKIASGVGGGPTVGVGDRFGSSVSALGDLDGDGVNELAVGAISDDAGGNYRGAVHVLFMNRNGTVKNSQRIAHNISGGPALADTDMFGVALASLGDLDGDGLTDLAVGAFRDDTGGNGRGATYILFLNANGTVRANQKIASGIGGGPTLANADYFGRAVASLGDLNGDGITDLAVGAYQDDTGGNGRGAVHILLLNANGTVKSSQKIASGVGGGPSIADGDNFGSSIATVGDLDSDGAMDLFVGAEGDDTGGNTRGAGYILFLKANSPGSAMSANVTASIPENPSSVMAASTSSGDRNAHAQSSSELAERGSAVFALSSDSAAPFVAQPESLRTRSLPLARREFLTTARLQDDALVAWLATRAAAGHGHASAAVFEELLSEPEISELAASSGDLVDVVFASLEVTV
jgi:hypothetical protein